MKALVTFDYAQPALWLGAALISGGVFLLNLRNVQPVSSKDSDIVLSCILVFSGGILIFQVYFSLLRAAESRSSSTALIRHHSRTHSCCKAPR